MFTKRSFFYIFIAFLVLLIFSGFFWVYEVRYFLTRADAPNDLFSSDNSYVVVSPLRAKANNQEKIRITIFILNNQGLGVQGQTVGVAPVSGIQIENVQGVTDGFGKAIFDVMGSIAGDYYPSVSVSGKSLKEVPHLNFY